MKSKIILLAIVVAVVISSLFTYSNFIKKYDLIINGEVVHTGNKTKINRNVEKNIEKYEKQMIEESRNNILAIETRYNESINLENVEEIVIKKIDDYTYEIKVIHNVTRVMIEDIPFEKEIINDDTQYTSYSEVTTPGVTGRKETTLQITYVNGEETDNVSDIVTTEPITEITTKGTKLVPKSNSGGNSSGSSGSGSSIGNAGGSSGGMFGDYVTYDACWSAGESKVAANGGSGSFGCLAAEDGSYYFYWWDR